MDATAVDALPADLLPAAFAEALDRAENDKARTTLTRNGKPVAVLVPVEDAETLEAWEDAEDTRLAALAHDEWVAAGRPPCVTLEELAAQHGIELSANPD
jgi:prevent-host-death family protein